MFGTKQSTYIKFLINLLPQSEQIQHTTNWWSVFIYLLQKIGFDILCQFRANLSTLLSCTFHLSMLNIYFENFLKTHTMFQSKLQQRSSNCDLMALILLKVKWYYWKLNDIAES